MYSNNTRRTRGFTLLELMIVVSIIAILGVMGMKIYGAAQRSAKVTKASLQVKAIAEAAQQYKLDTGVFPPDTAIYEGDDPPPNGLGSDAQAFVIHRYLGRRIIDSKTGAQYGPYLQDVHENLIGEETMVDGINCQKYCDPWKNPYELDCLHFKRDPQTRVVTVSKPYPPGTPEDQMTEDIKAWSRGPDGKSTPDAPFYPTKKNPDDDDNIMSWFNKANASRSSSAGNSK